MIAAFNISSQYSNGDMCFFEGIKYTFTPKHCMSISIGILPIDSDDWVRGYTQQDMIDFANFCKEKSINNINVSAFIDFLNAL